MRHDSQMRLPRTGPQSQAELHQWAKALDGHLETSLTFPVFSLRAMSMRGLLPQTYWEYARTYDETLMMLRRSRLLDQAGIAEPWWPGISLGVEFFASGLRTRTGRLHLPTHDDTFVGRHSVIASGWEDDGETIIVLNQWGDWGDSGVGYISRDYFERHVDDIFIRRLADVGPSSSDAVGMPPGRVPLLALDELWVQGAQSPNPGRHETVLHRGVRHEVVTFDTLSDSRFGLVDVLELRGPYSRIGRCHIVHTGAVEPASVIEELFVLPRFRRRGYGTLLEARARELAAAVGSKTIDLVLYEADGRPRVRDAPASFARALGYTWTWQAARRPNTVGVGRRRVEPRRRQPA